MSAQGSAGIVRISDVRRHHLTLVLGLLLRDGPRSRADLARRTGLTKTTVSSLVADLADRDLVTERAGPAGAVGRPATLVAATGEAVVALGMQIEVDHVAACATDLTGRVVQIERRRCDNRSGSPAQVLGRLAEVTETLLDDVAGTHREVVGACLAVPGLVEPATGEIVVAPNLAWSRLELGGLAERLDLDDDLPITVDNEANLGALAELERWPEGGAPSFVYVSGGVGVGAGIVVEGRLLRGVNGFGGEIGHLVVDPEGAPCACGARGCLETIVGAEHPTPTEARARALSRALTGVVHLIDPAAIVMGGTFADDDHLAKLVAGHLHSETLAGRWRPCAVRTSPIGIDAPLLGAARRGLDHVLADPTTIAPTHGVAST